MHLVFMCIGVDGNHLAALNPIDTVIGGMMTSHWAVAPVSPIPTFPLAGGKGP